MAGPSAIPPGVTAFLATEDAAEADRLLEALLGGEVHDTIRDVVRRTLGGGAGFGAFRAEDLDDVRGQVLLLLVQKLRRLKDEPRSEPIADLRAYAATVAYHACYAHLRRRRPQWTRLRNQVRYLLTHDPDLSLQRIGDTWSCALLGSGAGVPAAPPGTLREQLKTLLRQAAAPLALDGLVNALAGLRGVREPEAASSADGRSAPEEAADPRAPVSETLDDRQALRRLWAELLQLPLRQRAALLLNLRDAQGRAAVALLPLTGTASLRQIADALELPARELARLWKELPLDDLRIAERLAVSRQRVINLRKSARQRLARRLAKAPLPVPGAGNTAPLSDSALMKRDPLRKGAS